MKQQVHIPDLTSLSISQLTTLAIRSNHFFKFIHKEIEQRPPSAVGAKQLADAYRRGDAPPWLVAVLLGACRHPCGYATALEILVTAPRLLAEDYAGVALARIGGEEALDDLSSLVMNAKNRRSRRGAAYGLGQLGSPDAISFVLNAAREGKLGLPTAARIIGSHSTSEGIVLSLLATNTIRDMKLAIEILQSAVSIAELNGGQRKLVFNPSPLLLEELERVLTEETAHVTARKRASLTEWMNSHPRSHPNATQNLDKD